MEKKRQLISVISSGIFLAVILVGFCSILFAFSMRIIVGREESGHVLRNVNYADIYPFENETTEKKSVPVITEGKAEKLKKRYLAVFSKIKTMAENTKYYIPCYYSFVEAKGAFDRLTGINCFDGNTNVIALENGRLDWHEKKPVSEEEMNLVAETVKDFSTFLEAEEIPFIYMQIPCGIDAEDPQLPVGIEDFANENYDRMVAAMRDGNIETIDLREIFHDGEKKYTDYFYRTDHHWNMDGTFKALSYMAPYMQKNIGLMIDTTLLDATFYEDEFVACGFLGAEGRKTSKGYAGTEEFAFRIPLFENQLKTEYVSYGLTLNGSFKDVFLDQSIIGGDTYYARSLYEAQMYGVQPLSRIHNMKSTNDTHILIIGNSYGLSFAEYLSLMVGCVDLVDYRTNVGFNGSYRSLIREEKPDLVILMALPQEDSLFQFS